MNKSALGRLEAVNLRDYWQNESHDFTPWLAQPENIKLLGDAIGLDLEVEAQEKDVGPFSADILCKDIETNAWVVIENQLEPTDHSHLGQLLTYAAGLHASTVIWIAENFREEHRAALNWLNDITREAIAFYGVEVELLRIANSPPAPRFNVVSKPNEFAREAQTGAETELSEVKQSQKAFWTGFRDYLLANSKLIRPQKPAAQHWMSHSIGRVGCNLSSVATTWDSEANRPGGDIRAEVVLGGQHAKAYFAQLETEKEEIEREVGGELKWHNRPDKRTCRIYFRRSGDIADSGKWPEYYEWLRAKLEVLYRVFGPRLKALRAEGIDEGAEQTEP